MCLPFTLGSMFCWLPNAAIVLKLCFTDGAADSWSWQPKLLLGAVCFPPVLASGVLGMAWAFAGQKIQRVHKFNCFAC